MSTFSPVSLHTEINEQVERSNNAARDLSALAVIFFIPLCLFAISLVGFGIWLSTADLDYGSGLRDTFESNQTVYGLTFIILGLLFFIYAFYCMLRLRWLAFMLRNTSLNTQVSRQQLLILNSMHDFLQNQLHQATNTDLPTRDS